MVDVTPLVLSLAGKRLQGGGVSLAGKRLQAYNCNACGYHQLNNTLAVWNQPFGCSKNSAVVIG